MAALTRIFAIISMEIILSRIIICYTIPKMDEGMTCAVCTVLATLLFEDPSNTYVTSSLRANLCNGLYKSNITLQNFCLLEVQNSINFNPDKFCEKIGLCNSSCKLFVTTTFPPSTLPPAPPHDPPNRDVLWDSEHQLPTQWQWLKLVSDHQKKPPFYEFTDRIVEGLFGKKEDLREPFENAWKRSLKIIPSHPCYNTTYVLKCIVDRFADQHYPVFEVDGDSFAAKEYRGFRGSNWRGADCNDSDASIYPGRRQNNASSNNESIDHDCNGIYGINPVTGISWEETLCDDTPRRGLIHIGDSASAHFHIPPQWLTKNGWNLNNLIPDAVNELDQPSCAWGTGYRNVSSCPYSKGKRNNIGSIASRLRKRNLCIHRDFQNIAVNGARSGNAMGLVESVSRDQHLDHPALVIYSLIGNDVCNGHQGTSHMTTPQQFHDNILQELKALDKKLPPESAVLLVGLVDGRILWDNLSIRQHPVGATYEEVYSFLNCTECNPCVGWLTANETLRNFTTARAMQLNEELYKILDENIFQSFEAKVFAPDWPEMVKDYVSGGGDAADLFEPSDGFHPSQLQNEIFADVVWEFLETEFPYALGSVNPFNSEIKMQFGDQGGF